MERYFREGMQAIGDGGYAHKDEGRGGRESDDGVGEHRRRAAAATLRARRW